MALDVPLNVGRLVFTAGIDGRDLPVEVAVELAVEFDTFPPTNDVVNGTTPIDEGLDHAYDDNTVAGAVPAFVLVTPTPQESVAGVVVPV